MQVSLLLCEEGAVALGEGRVGLEGKRARGFVLPLLLHSDSRDFGGSGQPARALVGEATPSSLTLQISVDVPAGSICAFSLPAARACHPKARESQPLAVAARAEQLRRASGFRSSGSEGEEWHPP